MEELSGFITKNATQYTIEVEVPGFDKQDIAITTRNSVLLIEGKKTKGLGTKQIGDAMRIPDDVDGLKITASVENGMVLIGMPLKKSAKLRKIKIT